MAAMANVLMITVPKRRSFFVRQSPSPASGSILLRCSPPCSGRRIRACQPPDEVGGDGGNPNAPSASVKRLNLGKPLLNFAANNFLPLVLVGGVGLGLAYPTPGCLAGKYSLTKFSTFGIFIISGLTLRSEAVGAAAKAWPVGVFGLLSILFFTPYFSKLIMQIQLQPQEFVTGLAIFSCMPTTLSSGVALTHLAGGNSALALAMTVISNLSGIIIIPFSISTYVAKGVGISVPTEQLLRSLVVTLLIPLIFGKVIRESFKGLAEFVDQNRKLFSRINAILLSLVPWIQVSSSRSLLLMVKPVVFLVAIGMGIVLHLFLLAFNAISIRILSSVSGGSSSAFGRKDNATAALLVASQKTLPVMVAVVEKLGGALGESGLLVLPCVGAHLIQVVYFLQMWVVYYVLGDFAKKRPQFSKFSQKIPFRRIFPMFILEPLRLTGRESCRSSRTLLLSTSGFGGTMRLQPMLRQPETEDLVGRMTGQYHADQGKEFAYVD